MIVGGVEAIISVIVYSVVSVSTIVHCGPFVAGVGGVDDSSVVRSGRGAFTPTPGIGNGAARWRFVFLIKIDRINRIFALLLLFVT